jgi:hypothetical protein
MVAALAILALTCLLGGWEWLVPAVPACVVLWRRDSSAGSILAATGIGLTWIAFSQWSGDRRLYFPYTVQYAVQTLLLIRGGTMRPAAGGGLVVVTFAAIRLAQGATARVLAVKLAVAALILGVVAAARQGESPGDGMRAAVAAVASAAAIAGLAI